MKKNKFISILMIVTLSVLSVNSVIAEGENTTIPGTDITQAVTEGATVSEAVTPTEEAINTPTNSPEPVITSEPTLTEEVEPSVTNTPVAGVTEGEVLPTNQPSPTKTPTPKVTKAPSSSPTPSVSATPTGTPYATVVPPQLEQEYPSPKGKSDKSVEVKSPAVIKVDGIREELWDGIESVEIKNVAWGETGASGAFKVYWDKNALYVFVEVVDDTPDTASERFTRQDCVEIFVNESGKKPSTYSSGDCHFKVNRDGVVEYGYGANESNVEYALIPTEQGYSIEASISFSSINPVFDQIIGFDVRINDSQGNQYRDYMLQWSDTSMYTYKDLSKIGSIYLK